MSEKNITEETQSIATQPASSNPVGAFFQRGGAALRIRWLQLRYHLRRIVGLSPEGGAHSLSTEQADSVADSREIIKEVVYVTVPADPPPLARTFFIALLMLTIGLLAGAWLAYPLFATRLDSQAERIEDQQMALIEIEKENFRMQRDRDALLELRKVLADTHKELLETQLALSRLSTFGTARSNAPARLPASKPARSNLGSGAPAITDKMDAAAPPPRAGSRQETIPAAPQPASPGTCNIDGKNPQESLSRCISNLKQ